MSKPAYTVEIHSHLPAKSLPTVVIRMDGSPIAYLTPPNPAGAIPMARSMCKAYGATALTFDTNGVRHTVEYRWGNGDRKERAYDALTAYRAEDPEADDQTLVTDILTDLCHYMDSTDAVARALNTAIDHYDSEVEAEDHARDEEATQAEAEEDEFRWDRVHTSTEDEAEDGDPGISFGGVQAHLEHGGDLTRDEVKALVAKDYLVEWRLDVCATSPRAAAQWALEVQRDPSSLATVFHVTEVALRALEPVQQGTIVVDLHEERRDRGEVTDPDTGRTTSLQGLRWDE